MGTLRFLTLALLLVFALVWGINLLRVGISAEVFYSKHESLTMAVFSRGFIGASIVGLVAYVAAPERMAWSRLDLPASIRLCGAPVSAAGIALLGWVLATLGRNFSISLAVEGHTLVTDGPYRRVRHPMYTAFATTFVGFFLLSASWFVGVASALGYGAAMGIRTRREEHTLIDAFGDRYRDYMRQTGRFLPRRGRRTAC